MAKTVRKKVRRRNGTKKKNRRTHNKMRRTRRKMRRTRRKRGGYDVDITKSTLYGGFWWLFSSNPEIDTKLKEFDSEINGVVSK